MATGKVDSINYSAAVDAARAQAKLHKPFVDLADALEKIGSLDNAKKENEQALLVLSAEKEKLSGEIKSLKAKLDKGLSDIAGEVTAAKEAAANDLNAAKNEAEAIIESAKTKAAGKIAEAELKAKQIVANANAELSVMNGKVNEARSALNIALEQQKLAQAELDNINQKIDAAKAKVANLLG